jgi:hypothetical protein
VAEAKAAISYVEFIQWCQFRARYGSFHTGMRIDRAAARIGSLLANIHARKNIWSEQDLSPFDHAIAEASKPELTLDVAFAALTKIVKPKE